MCPEIPVLAHKFHSNFWHLIGPYSYMWPKYRPMIGSLTTRSFPKCTGQSFQIRGERIYSFHFSVLIWETENSPTLEENDHCWIFWSNLLKLVRSFRNKKGGLPINCQAQVQVQVPVQGPGQVQVQVPGQVQFTAQIWFFWSWLWSRATCFQSLSISGVVE